jgi:hypothetical protein
MKRNVLRPLTRPVRSPLHSSSVCSQRIEADTSSVGAPKSRSKPTGQPPLVTAHNLAVDQAGPDWGGGSFSQRSAERGI